MAKVFFCTPTIVKPYQAYLDAMEKTVPYLEERGWECFSVYEIGCPYISHARSKMLRDCCDKLNTDSDVDADEFIVFIDHDLSWEPEDMLALLEYPIKGQVVCGTYRFKRDTIEFMGKPLKGLNGGIMCKKYGDKEAVHMQDIPAGFLRIDKDVVNHFMGKFPELVYGDRYRPYVDLFNHGAHEGVWYGEDYAFSRRWREAGGEILCLPKLNLIHHAKDKEGLELPYSGTYDEYLRTFKPKDVDKQDSAA